MPHLRFTRFIHHGKAKVLGLRPYAEQGQYQQYRRDQRSCGIDGHAGPIRYAALLEKGAEKNRAGIHHEHHSGARSYRYLTRAKARKNRQFKRPSEKRD